MRDSIKSSDKGGVCTRVNSSLLGIMIKDDIIEASPMLVASPHECHKIPATRLLHYLDAYE